VIIVTLLDQEAVAQGDVQRARIDRGTIGVFDHTLINQLVDLVETEDAQLIFSKHSSLLVKLQIISTTNGSVKSSSINSAKAFIVLQCPLRTMLNGSV